MERHYIERHEVGREQAQLNSERNAAHKLYRWAKHFERVTGHTMDTTLNFLFDNEHFCNKGGAFITERDYLK